MCAPSGEILEEYNLSGDMASNVYTIEGWISGCQRGSGRSANDRQFIFINKRPSECPKVIKKFLCREEFSTGDIIFDWGHHSSVFYGGHDSSVCDWGHDSSVFLLIGIQAHHQDLSRLQSQRVPILRHWHSTWPGKHWVRFVVFFSSELMLLFFSNFVLLFCSINVVPSKNQVLVQNEKLLLATIKVMYCRNQMDWLGRTLRNQIRVEW